MLFIYWIESRRLRRRPPGFTATRPGSKLSLWSMSPSENVFLFQFHSVYHAKRSEGACRSLAGYLIDVIVHLVGHFFELVISHAEVSLVRVEMSVLPAAPSFSLTHIGGQVEGRLESLRVGKDKKKKNPNVIAVIYILHATNKNNSVVKHI